MSRATDEAQKVVSIATTATTIASMIHVTTDAATGEVASFTVGPAALFWRDDRGRPRVLGIPFGRWFRGPRK